MRDVNLDKLVQTDDEIDNEYFDMLIKLGCHENIKTNTFQPTEEELRSVTFSKKFEDNMKRMFKSFKDEDRFEKKSNRGAKIKSFAYKAAAVFAIIMLLSLITITTTEAARVKFVNVFIDTFDMATEFSFTENDSDIEEHSQINRLNYITEGFEIVNLIEEDNQVIARYENDSDQFITVTIVSEGEIIVDSENSNMNLIKIGEYYCKVSEKNGVYIIAFKDEENGFMIESNLDFKELENIIKNIR